MDGTLFFFIIFAALTVGCAMMVLISKDIVRSVVWLAATFLGVGILYLFLNAEYLFLIQILVYVGAINVLILFGIMLTKRRMGKEDACEEYEQNIVKRRRSP
ncbi:MAG TPA: NADH-quinone oxidoreductase subunit J [Methanomassiliicoccales archaeon]|jgi:NADH-quinone oxidoreductase subunit J|nr:NADH-quinone oxidoreductase subunit J [Euryarchaeota archaeon]HOE52236.1 NADH-quinone oxidoreductase subunit J [Methanomassiliicoccales archaeon]HOO03551.1 NADH-quinone oxidoreductase subunit J [Methanomassiliicoccales archaeon]HPD08278.1 NADH-quinone oxidoreductase subunit J [Methanomassiliicoccales archaeon]HQM66680.1 NADH-quinone oxidoreductase subunit J [Methanomassiliicoccales archaeon]